MQFNVIMFLILLHTILFNKKNKFELILLGVKKSAKIKSGLQKNQPTSNFFHKQQQLGQFSDNAKNII